LEIIKTNGLSSWDFKYKDSGVSSYLTKMANPKNYIKLPPLTKRAKDTAYGLDDWCLKNSLKNPLSIRLLMRTWKHS
jgi:hypothetical protein